MRTNIKTLFQRLYKQRLSQVPPSDDLSKIFGTDHNFGDVIGGSWEIVFDSDRPDIVPRKQEEMSELNINQEQIRISAANCSLGRYVIEEINKDPLQKFVRFDMKKTLSASLTEVLSAYLPILCPINFDYFPHIYLFTFFNGPLTKLPSEMQSKVASSMIDISYTQIKYTYLRFRFLQQMREHKIAMKKDKNLIFTTAMFEAFLLGEQSAHLIKASIEKTIDFVSIVSGCESRVNNTKKTQRKIGVIDKHFDANGISSHHWKALSQHFSSESLEDLTTFRTSLLHKRGIKELKALPENLWVN